MKHTNARACELSSLMHVSYEDALVLISRKGRQKHQACHRSSLVPSSSTGMRDENSFDGDSASDSLAWASPDGLVGGPFVDGDSLRDVAPHSTSRGSSSKSSLADRYQRDRKAALLRREENENIYAPRR